jgi:SOUL heme-binding protein
MRIARPILVAVSASAVAALVPLSGVASAVEEPPHRVAARDGDFEIRDYPTLSVAEVIVQGDRNSASYAGFRKLSGFVFGANARKRSIKMIAPVIEARADDAVTGSALAAPKGSSPSWVIRFVMPRGFSLADLPKPDDLFIRLRKSPRPG